jgi:hypothetical protein
MGWSSGTELFSAVIKAAKKAIPDENIRKVFYQEVYEAFLDEDWDTEDEVLSKDPIFEEVYRDRWNKERV